MSCNNLNLEFRKIKSLNFLFEVNSDGSVLRNVKSKRHCKIYIDKSGYCRCLVRVGKKTKQVMIHSVVAECWLGDRPDGYEVDHINRKSLDNCYENLRYVTHSEQMKNRDHSNISAIGSLNLERARIARMIPVSLYKDDEYTYFCSIMDASRFLYNYYKSEYDVSLESFRYRLRDRRKKIRDFDVIYGMQRLDTET